MGVGRRRARARGSPWGDGVVRVGACCRGALIKAVLSWIFTRWAEDARLESHDVTPSMEAAVAEARKVLPGVAEPTGIHGALMLDVSAADRRRLRLAWRTLLATKVHELWTKSLGKRIAGQGLIGADEREVRRGFESLDEVGFDRYNLPQVWVERRQVPRVLHQRVPRHNARILDLGCGPGYSTEILCYFADASWSITGYDLIDRSIARARQGVEAGRFVNARGQRLAPEFVCQSITEPLMDSAGLVPAGSVDLAISGGVVGLYLHAHQGRRLLSELRRVVRPRGYIALDAGPSIRVQALRRLGARAGFEFVQSVGCAPLDPRPKLVFRKR